MFTYKIILEGPLVEILHGENVFDVSGPWESLNAAIDWAEEYVHVKNLGAQEPYIG